MSVTQRPPEAANDARLLVGACDAAVMLSISQRTLWAMTQAGTIPFRRLGRRVLYSPADLAAWIAAGCPSATTTTSD